MVPFQVCQKLWSELDPHHHVFSSCQERVKAFRAEPHKLYDQNEKVGKFEKDFQHILEKAQNSWGMDLDALQECVDLIFHLESSMKAPLLYNWTLRLSDSTLKSFHILYSFLFHLRSLLAYDYNLQVKDPSYEALKMDSISDYIPRPDYVAQDALLFWKFKALAQPFEKDSKNWNLLIRPTLQSFKNLSHNAFHLVGQLPEHFMENLPPAKRPEALHLAQMDWLLGTEAGLLYRIREELFGVLGGYEKLFWTDELKASFKTSHLTIHTRLNSSELVKFVA
jgi:hypothetical protein